MSDEKRNKRLFIASFMTLIAAGMGFAIRSGGILDEWGSQFGFTKSELGEITGLGLAGFGVTIILCSLFADRVGYKSLMVAAFLLHFSSAVVTLAATPLFGDGGQEGKNAAMWCLKIGMTLFALANGV
ncbi:MAG: MFS transporter, partial [Pirellulales bacterium]